MWNLLSAAIRVYTIPYLPSSWQKSLAERRVIQTVQDAYRNVPFYQEKYDSAGVDIRLIRRLEDLKKLPLLTKEEVRRHYPGKIIKPGTDTDKCHHSSTLGSTGKPLSFIFSPQAYAYYLAESARIYTMIGYRPWYRSCYIRYLPMQLLPVSRSRQTYIWSMQPVDKIIADLRMVKPDLIDAYASNMLEIARNVTVDDLRYIRPRMITVNSEMSSAEEREYIAGVFGCPVYDEYSTEETWGIAAQCRRHNYHIFTDSVWLEFLNEKGGDSAPGEAGEIIITTTRNRAMPFIRYLVGDRGRPGGRTCGCVNNLPLMESIEGRSSDWLILPSGRPFEPERILSVIARIVKQHPLLFDEFKVVQQRKDLIVLQYSRGRQFEPGPLEEILEALRTLIYEPVMVKAEEGKPARGAKRQAMESWVTRDKAVLDSLDAR